LAALVVSVQNFFPHRTLFHFICPQAEQAVVPRRLSLNMCLC
jgi:hypothetical protein